METPSPIASPSDSNPNSAASPSHQNQQLSITSPRNTVVALAASTSSVARKTQPILWSHDETLLLIESYKEKWYAIGRGPLKSSNWEEISVAVSARSGIDRSATQCRHKIEKMRKRFRSERQSMGDISIWPFYSQMEELDSNLAPISARPLTRLPPNPINHYNQQESEDEEDDYNERQIKSRSINNILRTPSTVTRFAAGLSSCGERNRSLKRKRNDEEMKGAARAVAAEMKVFAERVMAMEKKKLEFVRETMKMRKEMEIQRLKLIENSQAQLLQFLNNAFDSF